MIDGGISDSDRLVVDSSIKAQHGDIIVAAISGEFKVKQLMTEPFLHLKPVNSAHAIIPVTELD